MRSDQTSSRKHHRQWRDYRTATGRRPIRDFFETSSDEEAAEVLAAMKEVGERGLDAGRHLRGDVYEVRADGANRTFRILFSAEGKFGQVFLSLVGFVKKTQKIPKRELELAEARLRDCESEGNRSRRRDRLHSADDIALTLRRAGYHTHGETSSWPRISLRK